MVRLTFYLEPQPRNGDRRGEGRGVCYDAHANVWTSIHRYGHEHEIKDPFSQARKAKYDILAKLRENSLWNRAAPEK